jgi:ABC-type branched-subunit amino acid transport system permease subunit
MSTFNGLPAHILFVHFIVVLAPLTALLVILSAVWPAARRRLVWLSVVLAAVVVILTPITTDAGEWLEKRVGRNPDLHTHTHLGDTFIYFAIGLLVVAVLVAGVHVRESRGRALSRLLIGVVAVLAIGVSVAATVQVYRIGESGSRSVWHGESA